MTNYEFPQIIVLFTTTTTTTVSFSGRNKHANCASCPCLTFLAFSALRHTLACSAWWWILTKCCPSTQRRSLKCTKERNDMNYPLISIPSLTTPTETWCKVRCLLQNSSCDVDAFILQRHVPTHVSSVMGLFYVIYPKYTIEKES